MHSESWKAQLRQVPEVVSTLSDQPGPKVAAAANHEDPTPPISATRCPNKLCIAHCRLSAPNDTASSSACWSQSQNEKGSCNRSAYRLTQMIASSISSQVDRTSQ